MLRFRTLLASSVVAVVYASCAVAPALAADPEWSGQAVAHDTSPPLSSLRDVPSRGNGPAFPTRHRATQTLDEISLDPRDRGFHQSQITGSAPATSGNWEGVNNVNGVIPPDTNGDVGDSQYVQWVNLTLRVYTKSNGSVQLTEPGNAVWSGFGTGTPASVCANTNQGDPVVLYDKQHQRWILTQFAFSTRAGTPTAPFYECIAVSQTSDATGQYNRYGFEVNAGINSAYFPDYPKFGVWSDGLYMTTNNFNGNAFAGPGVYAFDLASMLTGGQTRFVARQLSSTYEGLLPAHVDSATQVPPAGDQEYIGGIDTSSSNGLGQTFQMWRATPDFSAGTLQVSGPNGLPVTQYNWAFCGQLFPSGCISQPGTTRTLDPLADRLMNRLQYRHLNGADELVASHTVNVGSNRAGVRWYELRKPDGGTLGVAQQDTFAPDDGVSRWMGSAAMNANGDIALGYSAAGPSTYPSIRFTGRHAGDTINTMTQGEGTIVAGGGSQTGYSRWGDYSSMSVDPTDETTFWYTQEYYGSTSSYSWQTRIGSFTFAAPGPATLSNLTVSPSSVTGGGSATGTVTLSGPAPSGGAIVDLSSSDPATVGVPATVTVAAGASSATFGVSTSSVTTSTTATISAAYGGATRTATLTVNPAAQPGFTLSASPTSRSVKHGHSTTYTITVNRVGGYTGSVAFAASGLPSGATASFSPGSTTGSSSTLTVNTAYSTPRGTSTVTVTGTGSGIAPTQTVSVTLQVK